MKKRILLVDDAPFVLEILRSALEEVGYDVVPDALTGTEAISHVEEYRPNIILMDLAIPEINGLDTTQEILELYPSIKVIAMSSLNQPEMVMRALEVGCVDFMAKPFEYEELLSLIDKIQISEGGEAVSG